MTDTTIIALDWQNLTSAEIAREVQIDLDKVDCDASDYRWRFDEMAISEILTALDQDTRDLVIENTADSASTTACEDNGDFGPSPIIALTAGGPLDLIDGVDRLRDAIRSGRTTMPALLGMRAPHTFTPAEPALTPGQPMNEERTYQERVDNWMMATFGEAIGMSPAERNMRFLEEALELVQAAGMTRGDVETLTDYVFSREKGELTQELGGVSVCLAALATAHGADLGHAAESELARIWPKSEKIRAKHGNKPAAIRG